MAIIQGNAKQGSTRGFYPKLINGSLLFDNLGYLTFTPTATVSTYTVSFWVKLAGSDNDYQYIFASNPGTSGLAYDNRTTGSTNQFYAYAGSVDAFTPKYRDFSSWYHIVFSVTGGTGSFYVNGELVDTTTQVGSWSTGGMRIGAWSSTNGPFSGYLAEFHGIDGQALTPSDFGETKNGVWVAKDYAGTFGTNGFYLTFEDDTQVEAFNTVLYRSANIGANGTQSVTGVGYQPDLVWLKNRTSTGTSHTLFDSVRGAGKMLKSDATSAEETNSIYGYLSSFDSDGFTLKGGTTNANYVAQGTDSYVAWTWKAGDSNVSNTDGTITSTVRANPTYGFSIVSYTGTGSDVLIGHGLSSTPEMIITKNRDGAYSWTVTHFQMNGGSAPADNGRMYLNSTAGYGVGSGLYDYAEFTDTVYSINGGDHNLNFSGEKYIAYCWHSVTGYSKFGSYTGNGSSTGPVITTGFKPAFVMIKRTNSTGNWIMIDATRDVTNERDKYISANASSAEGSGAYNVDFDATGFQIKYADPYGDVNASGSTYIYAAFADTREAAFWLDQSGNDNDWQPVNLDHNDTVADSPTDNFCTLNPLNNNNTLSDGNLRAVTGTNTNSTGTMAFSSGQHYFEVTVVTAGGSYPFIGLAPATFNAIGSTTSFVAGTSKWVGNGGLSNGDVVGIAFDLDTNTFHAHINGTYLVSGSSYWDGSGMEATVDAWMPCISGVSSTFECNFGQQPFKYDPPA